MTESEHAEQICKTFWAAISKNGRPNHILEHTKECAKTHCSLMMLEFEEGTEKYNYYLRVRDKIEFVKL